MKVTAKLRYLRIAPRKVRLVADLIRGKRVSEALTLLGVLPKRATTSLIKLLKQAIANAKNNFQLAESNLYIYKIFVDEGPKLKRWRPRARGQALEIQKKTSHITLILNEIEKKPKKIKKVRKIEKAKEIKKVPKMKKPPKEGKPPTGRAKLRPGLERPKPKTERGIRRIFRRKAF